MRYTAKAIKVRKVGKTTIIFWSGQAIYVNEGLNCVVYHNWYSGRSGAYIKSFRPFRVALLKRDGLDFMEIGRIARHYGVICQGASPPSLEGKTIELIMTKEVKL